jgi:plasmid stabilization system protein ParE
MLEIEIRPRAQLDLESIYLYHAATLASPQRADETLDSLYASIERLGEFPALGGVFQSEELAQTYRRMLSGRYWIYYTFDKRTLTIWRVFHTARDIDDFTLVELG